MTPDTAWAMPESPAQTGSGYDLRPLSTGEILDRTFQLYRSRFALFTSLAALPAAVNFVGGTVTVILLRTHNVTLNGHTVAVANHAWLSPAISLVTFLVFLIFYGITQAATTWAVAEIYLGRAASVQTAWKSATADWLRYVRVVLRQYWSILWLPGLAAAAFGTVFAIPRADAGARLALTIAMVVLLLASFVYALYAAIRVSLGVPAAVMESLKANAAVRRSMALLTERKVRIFLMWLLLLAMGLVIGAAISPLQILAIHAQGARRYIFEMLHLAGSFVSNMLVGPVGAIALCLFYFDERVRHEGFDIEFLMQRAGGGGISDASVAASPAREASSSPEAV